jgi:hypothetical protein
MSKAVYNKPTLEVIGTLSNITEQFKHTGPWDGMAREEGAFQLLVAIKSEPLSCLLTRF